MAPHRLKAVTLMFHDAVEDNRFDDSGFSGLGPAIYKLHVRDMEAHFNRISAMIAGPPALVTDLLQGKGEGSIPLLLTFDDGGVSCSTLIADLLEKRGWRAHFMIAAESVGQKAFLSPGQIRDLRARGHLIGTHSWSHPERMSSCTWDTLLEEWRRSQANLSDLIGEPITAASVPGGFYSRTVARAASQCGIRALFTSEPVRRSRLVDQCLVLGRFRVARGMTPSDVAALCSASPSEKQLKQFVLWNLKKVTRFAVGEYYPGLRTALLRLQAGRRAAPDKVSVVREP